MLNTDVLDEKILSLQMDNKNFERNAKTSLQTLGALEKALQFTGADKALVAVENGFSGLGVAVQQVEHKFSALEIAGITALTNIVNKGVDKLENGLRSITVDQVTKGWGKYEDKTGSVQTIMAATGDSMAYVSEQLERLNWFTDETSYNYVDMVNNIGKFTSQNVDLETSVDAMQGIAAATALAGQNASAASRVMYNLSQALGAGAVKLIDWKSVENANVSTVELKQTIMDTAVELGTLRKDGDKYFSTMKEEAEETATSAAKSVKKVFDVTKNGYIEIEQTASNVSASAKKTAKQNEVTTASFNQTLSDGWFTSEVLIESLKKYGKTASEIYEYATENGLTASEAMQQMGLDTTELGYRAFAAAQEAKTLTDAIESIKDAASTKWMVTFETIFGNYEEAKVLWTGFANALYDVFATPLDAQNEALAAWKELGGRDSFIQGVKNTLNEIVRIAGLVGNAFRNVFPAYTAERLYSATKSFESLSENLTLSANASANLKRTMRGVFSILKLFDISSEISQSGIFGVVADIGASFLGGIAKIGDWIYYIVRAVEKAKILDKVLTVVRQSLETVYGAFKNIFGSSIIKDARSFIGSRDWNDFIEKLNDISSSIQYTTSDAFTLRRVARAVFTVFKGITDIFWEVGKASFELSKKHLPKLVSLFRSLAFNLSDVVIGMSNDIRSSDRLKNAFTKAKNGVDALLTGFENLLGNGIDRIPSSFESLRKSFTQFGSYYDKYLAPVAGFFGELFTTTKNGIGTAIKAADESDLLIAIFSSLAKILGVVSEAFQEVFTHVDESIWDQLADWIKRVADSLAISDETLLKIKRISKAVFTVFKGFINIVKGVAGAIFRNFDGADSIGGVVVDFALTVTEALASIMDPFANATNGGTLNGFVTNLQDFASGIVKAFSIVFDPIVAPIKQAFQSIIDALGAGLGGLHFKSITDVFATIFFALQSVLTGYEIKNAADGTTKVFNLFQGLTDFADQLGNAVTAVTDIFDKLGMGKKENTFWTLAKSIGLLTLSLVILSGIDSTKLGALVATVTGLFLDLIGGLAGTALVDVKLGIGKNLKSAAEVFTSIGVSLLLIAIAMEKLVPLKDDLGHAVLVITTMLGDLIAALTLTARIVDVGRTAKSNLKGIKGFFANLANNFFDTSAIKQFSTMSKGLLTIAASIWILADSVKRIGSLDIPHLILSVIGIGALTYALVKAFKSMAAVKDLKTAGIGKAFLGISIGVWVLASAVERLAYIPILKLIKGFGAVVLLLVALNLMAKKTKVATDGKRLLAFAASMVVMSIGIDILASAMSTIGALSIADWGEGLGAVLAIMAAMWALGSFVTPARATAMLGFGISMLMVGVAVNTIANAVSTIGALSIADWGEGLVGVLVIMGAMWALASFVTPAKATAMLAFGASMMMVGVATGFMATAMSEIGNNVQKEEMGMAILGLGVIAGLMLLLANTIKPKSSLGILAAGAGLLMISYGIKEISVAMAEIGKLNVADWGEAIGAVAIIFGLMAGLGAVLGALPLGSLGLIAAGVALIAIGFGMNVVAGAMQIIATVPFEPLMLGLAGLASALVVLGIAAALIPGLNLIVLSVGVAAMGAAIWVLAWGLENLGKLSVEQITTALLGFAAASIVLAAASILLSAIAVPMAIASGALFAFGIALAAIGGALFLIEMAIEEFPEAIEVLKKAGTAVSEWFSNLMGKISGVLQKLFPDIFEAWASFKESMEAIWNWLVDKLTWVYDRVTAFGEGIKNVFGFIGDWFGNRGEVYGSVFKPVTDDIVSWGTGVIDNIKKVFGINSPSKVMEDIFGYIGEGAKKGLEKFIPSIKDTAGELFGGVTDSLNPDAIAGSIQDSMSALTDSFDVGAFQNGLFIDGESGANSFLSGFGTGLDNGLARTTKTSITQNGYIQSLLDDVGTSAADFASFGIDTDIGSTVDASSKLTVEHVFPVLKVEGTNDKGELTKISNGLLTDIYDNVESFVVKKLERQARM